MSKKAEEYFIKKYPFYPTDESDWKEWYKVEIKDCLELMQFYADSQLKAKMPTIDIEFIKWLREGMWSKSEHTKDGIAPTEKWYNTYRYSVMENPLNDDELITLYKQQIEQ